MKNCPVKMTEEEKKQEGVPLKYAVYCRVSTTEQTTENQIISLSRYCKQKEWAFDVYEETISTRKTRPVKQEVLAKLRAFQYEGVVIWKLDRWARSSKELILEVEEMQKKGIQFVSVSDNIDLSTPTGKLQFQIMAAFAEFERNLIRERTMEGLARARMKGKKIGRPFGSTDKKRRRKAGYLLREAGKRKKKDVKNGVYRDIDEYINKKIT